MADSRIFGTLTKREAEILREFLQRFIQICPDADNKIDPADRKRIRAVEKIVRQVIQSAIGSSIRRNTWPVSPKQCYGRAEELIRAGRMPDLETVLRAVAETREQYAPPIRRSANKSQ